MFGVDGVLFGRSQVAGYVILGLPFALIAFLIIRIFFQKCFWKPFLGFLFGVVHFGALLGILNFLKHGKD